MHDGEYVGLAEPIWVGQVAFDQRAQQVLVLCIDLSFFVWLSLLHFSPRHSRNMSVFDRQARYESVERIAAEEMVQPRHLTYDAVIPLTVIDRFDGVLHVVAGIEESELSAKSDFAQNIECEEMQPISQVKRFLIDTMSIQLVAEFEDDARHNWCQLLHGGHRVRMCCHPLLLGMYIFSDLGEDIRVLWWREDPIEVGLVEAFSCCENLPGCLWGGKRQLIRPQAHNATIFAVKIDPGVFGFATGH